MTPDSPSSPAAVSYTFAIDPEDHVSARLLGFRPRRAVRFLLFLGAVGLVAALSFDRLPGLPPGRGHALLASLLGFGIFLLVWYYFLLPRQVRRIHTVAGDSAPAPLHGEIDADGLRVRTAGLHGTLPWSEIEHWKRDGRIVLLVTAAGETTIVPLRAFATDADRETALALFHTHLGPPIA